jgi:hypothetical protein
VPTGRVPGHQEKKAWKRKSNFKAMMIVFFDIRRIVHIDWMPEGQKGSWILHHDNAPAHNALSVKTFLAKHKIPVLEHPPYSPDLAPCDFFLFP